MIEEYEKVKMRDWSRIFPDVKCWIEQLKELEGEKKV